jgi:hypothetical protein
MAHCVHYVILVAVLTEKTGFHEFKQQDLDCAKVQGLIYLENLAWVISGI